MLPRLNARAGRKILVSATLCLSVLFSGTAMAENFRQGLDPQRMALAMTEAKQLQSRGQRVWCVTFARTATGVQIKGNAKTWWTQAKGTYQRGAVPKVGSVMAFQGTRKMPMGHVAVVSQVVSERKILIDHANWARNKVTLKMAVIDVSKGNDWSAVRVESLPNTFGDVYPVNGFIYPERAS